MESIERGKMMKKKALLFACRGFWIVWYLPEYVVLRKKAKKFEIQEEKKEEK